MFIVHINRLKIEYSVVVCQIIVPQVPQEAPCDDELLVLHAQR